MLQGKPCQDLDVQWSMLKGTTRKLLQVKDSGVGYGDGAMGFKAEKCRGLNDSI